MEKKQKNSSNIVEFAPRYYRYEFSTQGKRFSCIVRYVLGNRYQTTIYINGDNLNDFFIRNEVAVTLSEKDRVEPEVYNHYLERILPQIT